LPKALNQILSGSIAILIEFQFLEVADPRIQVIDLCETGIERLLYGGLEVIDLNA